MKNRWYRYFWTELGRRVTGTETPLPAYLPSEMTEVLRSFVPFRSEPSFRLGSKLPAKQPRSIYGYTWKILRDYGFSRSLRLTPWRGISLLVPFFKNDIGIIPQSFSERIPPEKRALSIVGRSAAALGTGVTLWVVPAGWNDRILAIFKSGGVKACSLDNLPDICEKGFT